jgi:2-aminoethylphosphonate-pyruvate transaminase
MALPHSQWLLTPGPLTTTRRTREAMLRDWGSRETDFIDLVASLCGKLLAVINDPGTHVCVPLQGSGTFSVEAAVGTLLPARGKALVLINGAYGRRIARICQVLKRPYVELAFPEEAPVDPARVAEKLKEDAAISHVFLIHCETTTGMLNPLQEVAEAVAQAGRKLVVDAMSSFGALPIDAARTPFEAVIAASGKCLEGAPGMGFILADEKDLLASAGNSHSLALDLADQYVNLKKTGQWRFTPPTHVLAALHEAVLQFEEEGGQAARFARYSANCDALIDAMDQRGFQRVIERRHQAPIIVTFCAPDSPAYRFETFYEKVKRRGFVLYPGKLTEAETFRVGCIGDVRTEDMEAAVRVFDDCLAEMGVRL